MRGLKGVAAAAVAGAVAGWLVAARRAPVPMTPVVEPDSAAPPPRRQGRWRRLSPVRRASTAVLGGVAVLATLVLTALQIGDRVAPATSSPSDLHVHAESVPSMELVGGEGFAFDPGDPLPGNVPGGMCSLDDVEAISATAPRTNPSTRFVLTNTFAGERATGQIFVYDVHLEVESETVPVHVIEFECPSGGFGSSDPLVANVTRSPAVRFAEAEGRGEPVYILAPGETLAFSVTITSEVDATVRVVAQVRSSSADSPVDLTEEYGPISVAGTSAVQALLTPSSEVDLEGNPVYYCADVQAGGFTGNCAFVDDRAPALAEFAALRVDQSAAADVVRVGER